MMVIILGAGNIVVSRMDTHPGLRKLKFQLGRWILAQSKPKKNEIIKKVKKNFLKRRL